MFYELTVLTDLKFTTEASSFSRHTVLQFVTNETTVVATEFSNVSKDVADEDEKCRPWYLSGGTRRPLPAAKSPKSGRRIVLLWPEEDPGSDRITNQLMFVLPSPSEGETSGQRLKRFFCLFVTDWAAGFL